MLNKPPKSLVELCESFIASRYSLFKERLECLPEDLRGEIQNKVKPRMQIIDGRYYAIEELPRFLGGDWGSYRN